jgi:hypothetical protein
MDTLQTNFIFYSSILIFLKELKNQTRQSSDNIAIVKPELALKKPKGISR